MGCLRKNRMEQISPHTFKNFIRHLCIVTKKHEDRELAKQRLKQQLQRVKQVSLLGKKRWIIEEELKRLESKVADVLTKELEILSIGREDSRRIKDLKDRIQGLEFQLDEARSYKGLELRGSNEKIEQLNNALLDMKGKLDSLIKTKRRKRKKTTKQKTSKLKLKIKGLEKKYLQLKKEGKFSEAQLDRLEQRIDLLKSRVC